MGIHPRILSSGENSKLSRSLLPLFLMEQLPRMSVTKLLTKTEHPKLEELELSSSERTLLNLSSATRSWTMLLRPSSRQRSWTTSTSTTTSLCSLHTCVKLQILPEKLSLKRRKLNCPCPVEG